MNVPAMPVPLSARIDTAPERPRSDRWTVDWSEGATWEGSNNITDLPFAHKVFGMDFSLRFNQAALSDVVLHLRPIQGPGVDDAEEAPAEQEDQASSIGRSYFLHKVILFQSPYFEKACAWKADAASPAAGSDVNPETQPACEAGTRSDLGKYGPWEPHWEILAHKSNEAVMSAPPSVYRFACCFADGGTALVEHVEEGELEAVELLLKSLYSPGVPKEAQENGRLLLQMYRLADKYDLPAVFLEPVVSALSAFKSGDIDLSLLSEFYSLPAGLLEASSLRPFIKSCQGKLVEFFGVVPGVIEDQGLKLQFCTLPHAAVLAWMEANTLKVHSESCVLLLLSAWVKAQPTCSSQQLELLACSIRVRHLSPFYLNCVLPDLKWFQEGCAAAELAVVPLLRTLQLQAANPDVDIGARCWRDLKGPAAWMDKKRHAAPILSTKHFDLGPTELATLATMRSYSSDSTYLNGVFYKLFAKVHDVKGGGVTLGVSLAVDSESSLNIWDEDQPLLLEMSLRLSHGRIKKTVDRISRIGEPWSHKNFLNKSGATLMELVAPFLEEGSLCLRATIDSAIEE